MMQARSLQSPTTKSGQGRSTLPAILSGSGFSRDGTPNPLLLVACFIVLIAMVQDYDMRSVATMAACVSMLFVGMPHGMFDYLTLQRRAGNSFFRLVAWITVYCGLAAVALIGWYFAPLLSLALFLVIAVIHFSEDWQPQETKLFSIAMATSMIALPALTYPQELSLLFGLVAGKDAGLLTDIVQLLAPLAGLVSLVFVAIEFSERRNAQALQNAILLASALLLPPGIGFAIFFCLYHSPRHFVEGYRELEGNVKAWKRFFILLTAASAAVFLLVVFIQPAAMIDQILIASIFQTLAILTVPHLLLPYLSFRSDNHPFHF